MNKFHLISLITITVLVLFPLTLQCSDQNHSDLTETEQTLNIDTDPDTTHPRSKSRVISGSVYASRLKETVELTERQQQLNAPKLTFADPVAPIAVMAGTVRRSHKGFSSCPVMSELDLERLEQEQQEQEQTSPEKQHPRRGRLIPRPPHLKTPVLGSLFELSQQPNEELPPPYFQLHDTQDTQETHHGNSTDRNSEMMAFLPISAQPTSSSDGRQRRQTRLLHPRPPHANSRDDLISPDITLQEPTGFDASNVMASNLSVSKEWSPNHLQPVPPKRQTSNKEQLGQS